MCALTNPSLTFRRATEADLPAIINLLADDPLGALREKSQISVPDSYLTAFTSIENDKNQELTVAEIERGIVGTFQLSFIQYLTHQGSLRAQIEAVRVQSTHRGRGIGTDLLRYAIDRARQRGCLIIQLTTDKQRPDAIRFYEALGFLATHEGMKLKL